MAKEIQRLRSSCVTTPEQKTQWWKEYIGESPTNLTRELTTGDKRELLFDIEEIVFSYEEKQAVKDVEIFLQKLFEA
jgi:replication-associated recombination protein RarA